MRKLIFPTLMAGSLMLGGCATGYGNDPLAGILGSVLGGQGNRSASGSVNSQFETAAVNACGQQASQYGQVTISNVQQISNDTLRVDGRVGANTYQQRSWGCSFRADGRITDFRMG